MVSGNPQTQHKPFHHEVHQSLILVFISHHIASIDTHTTHTISLKQLVLDVCIQPIKIAENVIDFHKEFSFLFFQNTSVVGELAHDYMTKMYMRINIIHGIVANINGTLLFTVTCKSTMVR